MSTSPFLRLRVETPDAETAGRVVAEAHEAGAAGVEELDAGSALGPALDLYVPAARAEALREAVGRIPGVACETFEPVAATDWSRAWREGLEPVVISPRLAVCPSFVPYAPPAGQRVLRVDPVQAFGTGHHGSTFLALSLLDALADRLGPRTRVLDVGTGTGVLALAATALGAGSAVALDVDPLAAGVAGENVAGHGEAGRVRVFAGTLDALGPVRFEVLVANLLRRELLPLRLALASHVVAGGHAVFSGLLVEERDAAVAALGGVGFQVEDERRLTDARKDAWLGLLTRRR